MNEPWHTLTVTATYGHRSCACGETCKGHPEPEPDQDPDDVEIEHELTHPDDCPPRKPCCHEKTVTTAETLLGLATARPRTCDACTAGAHEYCAESTLYRCQTEAEIGEYYAEHELPRVSGAYRVRGWWAPGTYYDDPESEIECEPVEQPEAEVSA